MSVKFNPDTGRTADVVSAVAHLKKVDKQARRVLNRGVKDEVARIITNGTALLPNEFNARDILSALDRDKWPHMDITAAGHVLAHLRRSGMLVRVGGMKSGLYRVRMTEVGKTPAKRSDSDVLDDALAALAEVEDTIRRYKRIIGKLAAAGITIEEKDDGDDTES